MYYFKIISIVPTKSHRVACLVSSLEHFYSNEQHGIDIEYQP